MQAKPKKFLTGCQNRFFSGLITSSLLFCRHAVTKPKYHDDDDVSPWYPWYYSPERCCRIAVKLHVNTETYHKSRDSKRWYGKNADIDKIRMLIWLGLQSLTPSTSSSLVNLQHVVRSVDSVWNVFQMKLPESASGWSSVVQATQL